MRMDTNLRKTVWSVPVAILVCVVMAGCGASSSTQQAPPAVSAAYLGYVDALRAGDGPRELVGLQPCTHKSFWSGRRSPNSDPNASRGPHRITASRWWPDTRRRSDASMYLWSIPDTPTGAKAELIVTQPYKDATNLKRRIVLKQVQGQWLFDGIYNLALTKQ